MKTATIETEIAPDKALEAHKFFSDKIDFTTGPVELNLQIQMGEKITIIDMREPEDFQAGHIPGAVNLPRDKWVSLAGLQRDRFNVLYCYSITCHLAAKAAVTFTEHGFPVMEMDGGYEAWKEHDLPIEA